MRRKIREFQDRLLKVLSKRIDDFYLGGGTALSLYYFNHRESLDLDFFTQSFNKPRVFEITGFLSGVLKKKMELTAEETRKNRVKILVYSLSIDRISSLKIDFIQDYLNCIKKPKLINGIKVLSLEDIYLRKIYAITGTISKKDFIGRKTMIGGRQEAKDYYDLYCLSHIFMGLSEFSFRYCNQTIREGLVRWYRTYSRLDIKTGLLELKLSKDIEYQDIERHFKREIDKILDKEVEFI